MDFMERFTEGARRALALAQESAKALGHNYVGSEHLLLGLLQEQNGAASKTLARFGVTESEVLARAEVLVGRGQIPLPSPPRA